MASERDKDQYQGSEYLFIGVDELTQFTEDQYLWLMSRLRKKEGEPIPLRMWSASNPGRRGMGWVKQRFIIEGEKYGRAFIRATLDDNPYLNREEYKQTLSNLDPVTRRQLLLGDWDAVASGGFFKRQWFEIIKEAPSDAIKLRSWDMAATPPTPTNTDPDWTAGVKIGIKEGVYYIYDIKHTRDTPQNIERLVKQTAQLDGQQVPIVVEQEGGSSGVSQIDYYRRFVLPAYQFKGIKPTGPKETRIAIVSSHAEAGNIKLVEGNWINAFFDEAELYPEGSHDDMLDACAQGVLYLQRHNARNKVRWL
jgi:predicted phage terminase large subunit-like protein